MREKKQESSSAAVAAIAWNSNHDNKKYEDAPDESSLSFHVDTSRSNPNGKGEDEAKMVIGMKRPPIVTDDSGTDEVGITTAANFTGTGDDVGSIDCNDDDKITVESMNVDRGYADNDSSCDEYVRDLQSEEHDGRCNREVGYDIDNDDRVVDSTYIPYSHPSFLPPSSSIIIEGSEKDSNSESEEDLANSVTTTVVETKKREGGPLFDENNDGRDNGDGNGDDDEEGKRKDREKREKEKVRKDRIYSNHDCVENFNEEGEREAEEGGVGGGKDGDLEIIDKEQEDVAVGRPLLSDTFCGDGNSKINWDENFYREGKSLKGQCVKTQQNQNQGLMRSTNVEFVDDVGFPPFRKIIDTDMSDNLSHNGGVSVVSSITAQSSATGGGNSIVQTPTLQYLDFLAGRFPRSPTNSIRSITEHNTNTMLSQPGSNLTKRGRKLVQVESKEYKNSGKIKEEGRRQGQREWQRGSRKVVSENLRFKDASIILVNSLTDKYSSYHHSIVDNGDEKTGSAGGKEDGFLSLPASAICWLASCFFSFTDTTIVDEEVEESISRSKSYPNQLMVDLSALKPLLEKNVTHLRITGEEWPPTGATVGVTTHDMSSGKSCRSDQIKSSFQDSFLEYLRLQPMVDISFFVNLSTLVLDGIIPDRLALGSSPLASHPQLRMLKIIRGCVWDISSFVTGIAGNGSTRTKPGIVLDLNAVRKKPTETTERGDVPHRSRFPNLTELSLTHCGIGEMSGLNQRGDDKRSFVGSLIGYKGGGIHQNVHPLSLLTDLVSLDLSHNEIIRPTTALAGLAELPRLARINISNNMISSMENAFVMVGNITSLVLSNNLLSNVNGIDRLYSLEELALDGNNITQFSHLSGLANLQSLMKVEMRNNPVEQKVSNNFRVRLLNIFREARCDLLDKSATFRDLVNVLPILDGAEITSIELLALKNLSFRHSIGPIDKGDLVKDNTNALILDNDNVRSLTVMPKSYYSGPPSTYQSLTVGTSRSEFPIGDMSRLRRHTLRLNPRRLAKILDATNAKIKKKDYLSRRRVNHGKVESIHNRTIKNDHVYEMFNDIQSRSQFSLEDVIKAMIIVPSTLEKKSAKDRVDRKQLDENIIEITAEENENDPASQICNEIKITHSDESIKFHQSVVKDNSLITLDKANCDSENDLKEVNSRLESENKSPSTKSLHTSLTTRLENTNVDIEEYKPKALHKDAKHLLIPTASLSNEKENDSSQLKNQLIDFRRAEIDSIYDGAKSFFNLIAVNYIELYFQTFVFPSSLQNESFEIYERSHNVDEKYISFPRIQLYSSDRDLMSWISSIIQENESLSDSVENRSSIETYVHVSREDVLPCGLSANARLPPKESQLRSFHGEFVYNGKHEVITSAGQKVIFCISNMAIYFIRDFDESFTLSNDDHREFPSPIPMDARFEDGFWPHAFSCHPLKYLRSITIGFGFQRLSLNFNIPGLRDAHYINPENEISNSSYYTYIIFTCNKKRTIKLLQILQSTVKELLSNQIESVSIDNDDSVVLDALGQALRFYPFNGDVQHYQILYQIWKNGDREPVQRIFVLTNSQIYLFNEKYCADSLVSSLKAHDNQSEKAKNVVMNMMISAELVNVIEICAADEDPRLITLITKASNRFMKSHKWRLVCKNGENAESLVDAIRKGIKACKENTGGIHLIPTKY